MIGGPNPGIHFLPWASGTFIKPLEGVMRFHKRSALLIAHTATFAALECVWWGHLPQARYP